MTIKPENKQAIDLFESTIKNAELRALQSLSLKQPLTHDQFLRFKELAQAKFRGEL